MLQTPMLCKCCGAAVNAAFHLDFSRSCEDRHAPVFPPCGEMVEYGRCESCGFVFSTHFDELTATEMAAKIYNDDYVLVDPEFQFVRPHRTAAQLARISPYARGNISVLDFGGGRGELARLLREQGFQHADFYDPFFGDAAVPERRYDLVTAFEVFEHTTDPLGTAAQAASFLSAGGFLLFSTLLQPRAALPSWWYIAPRNGHISIHTRASLLAIATGLNLHYMPIDAGLHIFHRDADRTKLAAVAGPLLIDTMYGASREGPVEFLRVVIQLVRLGHIREALNARHAIRMLAAMVGLLDQRR